MEVVGENYFIVLCSTMSAERSLFHACNWIHCSVKVDVAIICFVSHHIIYGQSLLVK